MLNHKTVKFDQLLQYCGNSYLVIEDYMWEKIHRSRFAKIINKSHQMVTHGFTDDINPILLQHSNGYQAAYYRNIKTLIMKSLQIEKNLKVFLDLGSGLGKALEIANGTNIFESVVGVELDENLHKASTRNFAQPSECVKLLNIDAGNYKMENSSTLVYLFNPFDNIILKKFLLKNIENFAKNKSLIAYLNHKYNDVLIELGFEAVYFNEKKKMSIWKIRYGR